MRNMGLAGAHWKFFWATMSHMTKKHHRSNKKSNVELGGWCTLVTYFTPIVTPHVPIAAGRKSVYVHAYRLFGGRFFLIDFTLGSVSGKNDNFALKTFLSDWAPPPPSPLASQALALLEYSPQRLPNGPENG